MTDYEKIKLAYIKRLLSLSQGLPLEKVVWAGVEELTLAQAREVAGTRILPNPYLIEGFKPNGMGPKGIVGRALVLDRFPSLLPRYCLESIGDIHDLRYRLGGSYAERARADEEFRRLIQVAGRELNWLQRFRLWRISWVYFAFVRGFGGWFFNWIKKQKGMR